MRILIVYGTTDGQTARIAERIAVRLRGVGYQIVRSDLRALGWRTDPVTFDAILVGGSLHAGKYPWRVGSFIREHLAALQSRPSAFFSVCHSAASRLPKNRREAHEIPRRFVAAQGWTPDEIEVIAGKLSFSRQGFLQHFFARRTAEKELGAPVDTTRDHELTDWARVDAFALAFAKRLERRRGASALFPPGGAPASFAP